MPRFKVVTDDGSDSMLVDVRYGPDAEVLVVVSTWARVGSQGRRSPASPSAYLSASNDGRAATGR